jgi:hypothetical protein
MYKFAAAVHHDGLPTARAWVARCGQQLLGGVPHGVVGRGLLVGSVIARLGLVTYQPWRGSPRGGGSAGTSASGWGQRQEEKRFKTVKFCDEDLSTAAA